MTEKSIFFDYDKIQSFDALFSFLLAGRGCGKTFGAITAVVKDFLKNGNQFVYVRRYKSELKTCVPSFFSQHIVHNIFPDHDLEVKGNKFYVDGELAGYAIALSTSKTLKSTGFPLVRTIIFDEFTVESSVLHYLSRDVEDLLDLVETIGRMRDNIRVWFLGNSTSIYNPYFNYFSLTLPYNGEFRTFKDGLILVGYIESKEYAEEKKKTRFGRVVQDTRWGEYAIDNKFLRDSPSFIHKRPPEAEFFFNLHVAGNTFGIWMDDDAFWYVSNDYDPDSKANFAFTKDDHTETTLLRSKTNDLIKNLIQQYRDAHLVFEDAQIKGCMVQNLLRFAN